MKPCFIFFVFVTALVICQGPSQVSADPEPEPVPIPASGSGSQGQVFGLATVNLQDDNLVVCANVQVSIPLYTCITTVAGAEVTVNAQIGVLNQNLLNAKINANVGVAVGVYSCFRQFLGTNAFISLIV